MLARFDDDIWTASYPFKAYGVRLGGRMVVVRLPESAGGGLWIHSPIPATEALLAATAELGAVRWLVAPNLMHHLYIGDWKAHFPAAKLVAPRGLERKRRDLVIDYFLDEELPWHGVLHQHFVEGMPKLAEAPLFHAPTQTLICCDLLFNICEPQGGWSGFVLETLSKATGGPRQSRIFRGYVKDREAYLRSVDGILRLPFKHIILAHGDVIRDRAKVALRAASAWAREGSDEAIVVATADQAAD